ncbi:MAG: integration host factor subunit beta [Flavobacteriales bacterium]|nr:integration host factor subunit beta [Flavobacteriales bacterium]
MTKADIVNSISNNLGMEKRDTQLIIEAFMDEVKKGMISGENVYLRGFGTFLIKERKEKKGRNISSNTTITIPAHSIPAFKPSKEFAENVKKNVLIK